VPAPAPSLVLELAPAPSLVLVPTPVAAALGTLHSLVSEPLSALHDADHP